MSRAGSGRRFAAAALLALAAAPWVASSSAGRADEGDSELEVPEAKTALGVLEVCIKKRAWSQAFTAASLVVEKHGDDLIAASSGVLLPARRVVRRLLAELPEEGRVALEQLYGDEAKKKLEAAAASPDTAGLEAVADRFACLDAGAQALVLAGDRWLERGCVPFAVAAWREVAGRSPVLVRRAEAVKRLRGALPLLGSSGTCADLAEEVVLATPEETKEAREALRALGAAIAPAEDVSVDGAGTVAPLASFATPRAARWTAPAHAALADEHDWRNAARRERTVPVLTAGSIGLEDALVLHLGRVLVALDRDTGAVRWRHEDRRSVRFFAGLLRARATTRFGVTQEGGRLYATLQTDPVEADTPRGRLVALDARTGKLLWDALEGEWGTPDDDPEKEARLSFTGTPLTSGGKVFCGATSATNAGETWVTATDADGGRLLWKRRLAVAAGLAPARNPRFARARELSIAFRLPAPELGVVKGALVVASANGCLAALDPADGRALWARSYESQERANAIDPADFGREANPVLGVRGLAVVAPPDSKQLLVVRVADGALAEVRLRGTLRELLGVSAGRLIALHQGSVVAFDVGGDERLSESWTRHLDPGSPDSQPGIGRGVLGRDTILAPTKRGVFVMDRGGDGAAVIVPWPEDRRVQGDLVIAGPRVVSLGVLAAAGWGE